MPSYSNYIAYFKNLAEQHTEIDEDSAAGKKGFFRMAIEEMINGIRSEVKSKGVIMRVVDYQWDTHDSGDNNAMKHYQAGFMIMGYHGDKEDVREQIQDKTERIVEDIIARIRQDSFDDTPNENSLFYDTKELMSDFDVSPMLNSGDINWSGWMVFFKYGNRLSCQVDENKWKDLP